MKITPNQDSNSLDNLTPLEQNTRKASIIFAFISVFVWAAKILFF
jgi:hypothetical protein